jgi:pimeloyl-ACP methyl ester carboxylesterase
MLHHNIIGNPNGSKVAVLHGIFGAGSNWRQCVGEWEKRRPDLQFVLIDLPNHGNSPHLPSQNTLQTCAEMVLDVQNVVGEFQAILGHSFGGKVAMQCAIQPVYAEIQEIWILDSYPGAIPAIDSIEGIADSNDVVKVLDRLRNMQMPVEKRSQVKHMLLAQGFSQSIAQWMTTNLEYRETIGKSGYHWKFHLEGIAEMLEDYFAQDLWYVLEDATMPIQANLLRALRSDRWDFDAIQRLEQLPSRSKQYTIDAGHWIHVDNLEGLLSILEKDLLAM